MFLNKSNEEFSIISWSIASNIILQGFPIFRQEDGLDLLHVILEEMQNIYLKILFLLISNQ